MTDGEILLERVTNFKSDPLRRALGPQPVAAIGTAIARQLFEPGRHVASSPLRATAAMLVARHA